MRQFFVDANGLKAIHNVRDGFFGLHFGQVHGFNKVKQRLLNNKGRKHDVKATELATANASNGWLGKQSMPNK